MIAFHQRTMLRIGFFVCAIVFCTCGYCGDLTLTIQPDTDQKYSSRILAVFKNNTDKPVRLLKPLDGSEWKWHKPYYLFTVTDKNMRKMPLGMRCGLSPTYSDIKWEDYLIHLAPGESYKLTLYLTHQIFKSDEYEVSLSYIFDETRDVRPIEKPYPVDLWRGMVTSKPIRIYLEKNANN